MELYVSIGKQIKEDRTRKGISLYTLSDLIGGIKTKSTCNNMYLHISTTSFFFPSLMIPYITKEVKAKKVMNIQKH